MNYLVQKSLLASVLCLSFPIFAQNISLTTVDGSSVDVTRQEVLRGLKEDAAKNSLTYQKLQFVGRTAIIDFPQAIYNGANVALATVNDVDFVGICKLYGFQVALSAVWSDYRCSSNTALNAVVTQDGDITKIHDCSKSYPVKQVTCKNQ